MEPQRLIRAVLLAVNDVIFCFLGPDSMEKVGLAAHEQRLYATCTVDARRRGY
jgi:hypothetical protein